jgi:hypothetical protein
MLKIDLRRRGLDKQGGKRLADQRKVEVALKKLR